MKKILLDTNVLQLIIEIKEALIFLSNREPIKSGKYVICITPISLKELEKNLGENFKVLIEDLRKSLNYKVIEREDEDYEKGMLLLQIHKPKLHIPDNFILAMIKREKIDIVYSTDNDFLDVIKDEGIEARKFPTSDKIIEYKLKRLF